MEDNEDIDDFKVQLYGVLFKKQSGYQSKWTKRFFIIKDGFFVYYPENEKKEFDKRRVFNVHPRGAIPMGGCVIEAVSEHGHPFAIRVRSPDINGVLVVATESEYERDKWMNVLLVSSRVTWHNAELGQAMIQQLETQGLQMAKEKQDYFDKLQNEVMALHDEKVKTEELEQVKGELEKEKMKMQKMALDLQEEYNKLKLEMADTAAAMKIVEEDRYTLHAAQQKLQNNLQSLEDEKERIITELQQREMEALKLSKEKDNLSEATETLKLNLQQIEQHTKCLLGEKASAEQRLAENEKKANILEDEKENISEHRRELEMAMKDLAAQKAVTEAELKEEILARLEAEKRLKEAEESLTRLEKAVLGVEAKGQEQHELQEEMLGDVKTLKHFFENLAFEAKLDADKPVMMKNSIHARKQMVHRAKTMKYEASRRKRHRASMPLGSPTSLVPPSMSTDHNLIRSPSSPASPPALSPTEVDHETAADSAFFRHTIIGLEEGI